MPTTTTTPQTDAFNEWLSSTTPGQVFTYHTGFLAVDRGTIVDYGDGQLSFVPNGDVDELGKATLSAFDTGRVHLFQRKVHDRVYQYIAMKRREGGRNW